MYVQTGSVRNKGIELSLGYHNTWNNNFSWSSNFTFSANKNEILELMENYENPITHEKITLERLDVGGLGYARFVLKKEVVWEISTQQPNFNKITMEIYL